MVSDEIRKILKELHPDAKFGFSNSWFASFKKRFRLSHCRATNACQIPPEDKRSAIQQFHRNIRRAAEKGAQVGPLGIWKEANIANMDQTPLPFCFNDGETYADRGERSVWVRGGASGLSKRQCTVQLTIFADGQPRVKPLLIFLGQGSFK